MSLVGHVLRCLTKELIVARAQRNVYSIVLGITGLAQINSVDIDNFVSRNRQKMIKSLTVKTYFGYIMKISLEENQGIQ